ncbi:regulation of enolase 1 (plasmid) [Burkholderia sp. KK1]|nr:regulation of enolase 1 [Burkholderia sp. KK1]
MFDQCEWINEPAQWRVEHDTLFVATDANTDFWRKTHYGFVRDSGHVFAASVNGDFTAEVTVDGDFSALYDQAGLMVRESEARWVKAGAEYNDGALTFSTVLTNERSDWSLGSRAGANRFRVRMTIAEGLLKVQCSADEHTWTLMRLAPFAASRDDARWLVGPMCCTPERGGLDVCFSDFRIGPPIVRDLHDISM